VDSTLEKALAITAQWSQAASGRTVTIEAATVELCSGRAKGTSASKVAPEAARALLRAIPVRSCPACGKPLTAGQGACSGQCRATLSRRRHEQRQQDRDTRVAALLREAVRLLEEGQI